MSANLESVVRDLKGLKLSVMATNLPTVIEEASRSNHNVLHTIKLLLELERESRWKNSIDRRFLLSRLTEKVTIDQFDFTHHESRQQQKNVTGVSASLKWPLHVVVIPVFQVIKIFVLF